MKTAAIWSAIRASPHGVLSIVVPVIGIGIAYVANSLLSKAALETVTRFQPGVVWLPLLVCALTGAVLASLGSLQKERWPALCLVGFFVSLCAFFVLIMGFVAQML